MKINRYLSPYGGGDCGPPPEDPPCQGPDCPGSGCEPWCDELCLDGSWPPCDDGPSGDSEWHVYLSCVEQAEVIILDNSMPSITNDDIFNSQNNHFNTSQTNLQQDIELGDTFCGTPCQDGIMPGVYYPSDCYTYLGVSYGSMPATVVAGGLSHPSGYWAGSSYVNGALYDLSVPNCDNCGEDPEPPPQSGCMDPVACNYNLEATGISVGCCYEEGCTDPSAFNYEIGACCDDGSCCYTAGCTDQTACNWDHGVSCHDDGSCCYVSGCMDAAAFNYNSEACCGDGSCCYTSGCTDPTATNYDPLACYDDGSCEYCTSGETNSCETNGATNMNQFWDAQNLQNFDHLQWFISSTNYQIPFGSRYFEIDADGSPCGGGEESRGGGTDNPCTGSNNGHYMSITNYEVSVEFSDGTTQSQVVSSWNDAITFLNTAAQNPIFNSNMDWTAVQTYLDEIFGGTNTNFWTNGWNISIGDFECCECAGGSTCGCTDSTATNYDALATFDDGSCTYCTYGCTDEACDNYDSSATCDDGSCNCEGDDGSNVGGCTDDRALNYDPNETTTNNDLCEWEVPLYCTYNLDTSLLTTPSWISVTGTSNSIYDWVTHLNDTHSIEFGGTGYGASFDVGGGGQYDEEICATYLGKFIHTGDPDDYANNLISTVGVNGTYGLPNTGAVLNQADCVACADDPLLPDFD